MNIRDQLKLQSQQVAASSQSAADFFKRTDKLIDANMVASEILEAIRSDISFDIDRRNYKSYAQSFYYEGVANTQFELHIYDDGVPEAKDINIMIGEAEGKKRVYVIYSLVDIDNIYSLLKKELDTNFKNDNFFRPWTTFGFYQDKSPINVFTSVSKLCKYVKNGVKGAYKDIQSKPSITMSTIIFKIETVARLRCDKNGVIK